MKKTKCDICGKILEGYTEFQVKYLLRQHKLTHEYDDEEIIIEND